MVVGVGDERSSSDGVYVRPLFFASPSDVYEYDEFVALIRVHYLTDVRSTEHKID